MFSCKSCNLRFTSEKMYKIHDCNSKKNKRYKCEHCFIEVAMKLHYKDHAEEKSNKHDTSSPEKFNLTSDLRINDEKKFKCTKCDKSYSYQSSLTSHLPTHIEDRPHKCTYCDKSFMWKSLLKSHLLSHTGEKFFKCTLCNKSYTQKNNLMYHLITHSVDKPYKCTYCAKSYTTKYTLKYHLHIHTEGKSFKCADCDKSYSCKNSLITHLRTHKEDKPHKCNYCNKCFVNKYDLKIHLQFHTGEKLFKCTHCSRSYCFKRSLQYHISTHLKNSDETHAAEVSSTKKSVKTLNTFTTKVSMQNQQERNVCLNCREEFGTRIQLVLHVCKYFFPFNSIRDSKEE